MLLLLLLVVVYTSSISIMIIVRVILLLLLLLLFHQPLTDPCRQALSPKARDWSRLKLVLRRKYIQR